MKNQQLIIIFLICFLLLSFSISSFGQEENTPDCKRQESKAKNDNKLEDDELCFDSKAEKPEIKRAIYEKTIDNKTLKFSDCCPMVIKSLEQPSPEYPKIAALMGIEGKVTVRVVINENGKVVWAKVEEGHPLLRQTSLKAICKIVFKPYVCHCGKEESVGFETLVTYIFEKPK